MVQYKNLSGRSGVAAYSISRRSIRVLFWNGKSYLYTYESAGPEAIEEMKRLAKIGLGLNTFINTTVRADYVSER